MPSAAEGGTDQGAAARLLEAVAADPVVFVRSFHVELFRCAPELAERFPSGLGGHHAAFVTMTKHILQGFADGSDPPALIDLLGQLGRDHRKYQLGEEHYRAAKTALAKALADAARSTRDNEFCAQAAALVCAVMEQESNRRDGPQTWEAQVVERIDHPGPTVVVRLRAAMRPQPFAVSQYLAVQVPQRPGQWRYYSPALPPNDEGELEFHIRAVPGGMVSGAVLKNTQPGDRWLFGESYGSLAAGLDAIPADQSVLMVAGDTGLAPCRAIALALALRSENPRMTLLAGARSRAECYDLPNLRDLARDNEWFNVLPVIDPTPWAALARTAVEFAKRSEVVLLSGPPMMIDACLDALRAGGVSLGKIRHDPRP
ncbi:Oxidoreductase FAD-binding domain protein [Segniliparus rotundus DSM 44985]|uniref:Oxidoreductase FAD-binding domain protein n=1 Tax=Segniliparus rotundus (strain ATCC BAA-972 / CDC 1076 / CIP 108378 / DSM 44985 / JCM 13578) TaxID=640132 RepID=D6Z7Y9_SEGRD|nr:FAD-binding oxidoreductase [Segniliparus rotundus]ADG98069.1 Oxidoreductase FAD-binding domain protein [Segniliparus rotundus DSM 44985]